MTSSTRCANKKDEVLLVSQSNYDCMKALIGQKGRPKRRPDSAQGKFWIDFPHCNMNLIVSGTYLYGQLLCGNRLLNSPYAVSLLAVPLFQKPWCVNSCYVSFAKDVWLL